MIKYCSEFKKYLCIFQIIMEEFLTYIVYRPLICEKMRELYINSRKSPVLRDENLSNTHKDFYYVQSNNSAATLSEIFCEAFFLFLIHFLCRSCRTYFRFPKWGSLNSLAVRIRVKDLEWKSNDFWDQGRINHPGSTTMTIIFLNLILTAYGLRDPFYFEQK
jgi:hypothetical protein